MITTIAIDLLKKESKKGRFIKKSRFIKGDIHYFAMFDKQRSLKNCEKCFLFHL